VTTLTVSGTVTGKFKVGTSLTATIAFTVHGSMSEIGELSFECALHLANAGT
jgi:hypothetical protein